MRLAQELGGVVVNADSMQVYRELSILTARPSEAHARSVRHMLYGYVSGGEAYSVGRWLVDVAGAIAEARRLGLIPIVTGGTGLYFKALLDGLSPIPQIPEQVRSFWREEARRLGPTGLHALLTVRDPDTASRLQPSDTQRLTRAIEVLEATGRGLSDWQKEPGIPVIEASTTLRLVVAPERAELHRRADARFDAMIDAGALEEVRELAKCGHSSELPLMRALGVAPLLAAEAGEMPLADAVARAKLDTRQYIKRQETWLRRNMIAWKNIKSQEMERNMQDIFTFMRA